MLNTDEFCVNTNNSNNQRFESREIIFRNISIDATVLRGVRELLAHKSNNNNAPIIPNFYSKGKENNDHSRAIANNTDIDIIHCSGLVSELIRIVLPTARRFGFAGTIPIAHNLDTEGLGIIGENLRKTRAQNEDDNQVDKDTDSTVRLKSLVLKGTRLESSGFHHFCEGLGNNTTLEELQLSTCILEEEDVILLASTLRKNKSLKSVFFANCKFGTKNTIRANLLPNGRVIETTQSINNANPQINLPAVLEALVRHPTLESLKIYDMVCNEQAIQAIGEIVSAPESKLQILGLKNNLSHPRSKLPGADQHLFPSLSQNHSLTYLKLSGNNLNDENMVELGRILTESRTSIQTLSIADNLICNGLLSLSSNLSNAKSLRWLDVLRNPIKKQSIKAMVSALENNVELERLDLDGAWDEEKFWWLSLNKGGRRALSGRKSVSSSLWPTILERAYKIPTRRNSKHGSSATTNAAVAYYLIRRIPWLFEKASTTTTTPTTTSNTNIIMKSRPEQKRQRERIVTYDSIEDAEPKAKRMFNA